jgi:zinc transporter
MIVDQPVRHSADKYGSDRNGMVWGYVFQRDGSGVPIDSDQAATDLRTARADGTFYWLHFSLANSSTERWLHHVEGLPKSFFEGLGAPSSATRVEQDNDVLVAVMNDVLFDFHSEGSDVSTTTLAVLPGGMISVRLRPLRSIDRLRESVKAGATCRSPVELLSRLLQNQAEVLVDIVRRSGDQVDAIEDSVLGRHVAGHRIELSALRRRLVRLERLLAPEPSALFRLLSRPPGWIEDADLEVLRQSAEEFSAVIADCTALVERAKLIQEELAQIVTEQTNRSLFILTFVTVLLLPFNVVGGLFGMNVGGIPYGNSPHGFWVIVVLITALTATAGYFLLRRFRS